MKFPFRTSHTALLWFRVMEMLRHFHARVFLVFSPPPPLLLFALNLPLKDSPSGWWPRPTFLSMVKYDSLLLLLLQHLASTTHNHQGERRLRDVDWFGSCNTFLCAVITTMPKDNNSVSGRATVLPSMY
jgi:hypothetical protein